MMPRRTCRSSPSGPDTARLPAAVVFPVDATACSLRCRRLRRIRCADALRPGATHPRRGDPRRAGYLAPAARRHAGRAPRGQPTCGARRPGWRDLRADPRQPFGRGPARTGGSRRCGLRTGRRLSHATFLDLPGLSRRCWSRTDAERPAQPGRQARHRRLHGPARAGARHRRAERGAARREGTVAPAFPSTSEAAALKSMALQGPFRRRRRRSDDP